LRAKLVCGWDTLLADRDVVDVADDVADTVHLLARYGSNRTAVASIQIELKGEFLSLR
jgi:hypothetical protein